MPKEIPDCPGGPPKYSVAVATRDFAIRLVTPMFGGGAEAGKPDPLFPIRPTAVRGQLQFWWRATIGGQHADRKQLFEAHANVWGKTETASPVEVEVRDVKAGPLRRYDEVARGSLGYALFPFQEQRPRGGDPGKPAAQCLTQLSFTLRCRFPESLRSDVETAVWAWVNFGGAGARTRRGCGTLFCEELAPKTPAEIAAWFRARAVAVSAVREWPTLPAGLLYHPGADAADRVWSDLIEFFKHFRQGEGFARNERQPGERSPGRSRYPEPETIRRITGRRSRKHEAWDDMPDGFPRAEFGLPIVFHFKDENQGEPSTTTLNPYVDGKALERMASPLILKPLTLGNGTAVPLILVLDTPGIQQVELQDENKTCLTPRHAVPVRNPGFATTGSLFHGLSASGSALDAFRTHARSEGFVEVTR